MNKAMAERVHIRAAGQEDCVRLSLVSSATFLETYAGEIDGDALVAYCEKAHDPAYLKACFEKGAKAWLVELDSAPIGYALLSPPDLDAAIEGDVELKKIYLLSRFHGSGIAAQLFNAAKHQAQGYRRLLLGVKKDNSRAISFYKKQGFAQISTRRFDVGGTLYDDVVLALDLEQEFPA